MSDILSKSTKLFWKEEAVAGTPETIIGSDGFDVESGFSPMTKTVEEISRNNLSAGEGTQKSQQGVESSAFSVEMEFKCADTEGDAPEAGVGYHSCLGGKTAQAQQAIVSSADGASINVAGADSLYKKGMILTIEDVGGAAKYSAAIADISGDDITLTATYSGGAFAGTDVVRAITTFYTEDSSATAFSGEAVKPSMTVLQQENGSKHTTAAGVRPESLEITASVFELPKASLSAQGLSMTVSTGETPLVPSFDTTVPNVVRNAPIRVNGAEFEARDFSLSVSNTVANRDITNGGRTGNFITEREVTGSFTIYAQDDSTVLEDIRDTNADIQLEIIIPSSAISGDYEEVASICVNDATITNVSYGNESSLGTATAEFKCYVANPGQPEVVLSFS